MGTHLALSAEARIMIEAPALAGPRAACNPRFCARTSRRVGLAGEIVFADRAADMLEHGQRLALRVQCLAPPAGEILRPQHRIDDLGLVVLGDPRETHDLPRLLRQHVADEIVPRVMPEGRLSCSRYMIRTIAPFSLSLSRL